MWSKIAGVFAAIGAIAASIFYVLFNKEKAKAKKSKKAAEFRKVTEEAKTEAKEAHEEVKKKGPEAVSDDTDSMLLG